LDKEKIEDAIGVLNSQFWTKRPLKKLIKLIDDYRRASSTLRQVVNLSGENPHEEFHLSNNDVEDIIAKIDELFKKESSLIGLIVVTTTQKFSESLKKLDLEERKKLKESQKNGISEKHTIEVENAIKETVSVLRTNLNEYLLGALAENKEIHESLIKLEKSL